ncbi:MAG: hypothetical protein R3E95_11055 [Thiolinea sp.]
MDRDSLNMDGAAQVLECFRMARKVPFDADQTGSNGTDGGAEISLQ